MQFRQYSLQRCRFLRHHPVGICDISASADSKLLTVSRSNGVLEVYDTAQDLQLIQYIPLPSCSEPPCSMIQLMGKSFALAGVASYIHVYSVGNGCMPVFTTLSHGGAIYRLSTSEDGSLLAAGCEDNTVRYFKPELTTDGSISLRYIGVSSCDGPITAMSFSRSELVRGVQTKGRDSTGAPIMVAVGTTQGVVHIFDVAGLLDDNGVQIWLRIQAAGSSTRPVAIGALAWLAAGEIAFGDADGAIQIFNITRGASFVITLRHHCAPVLALASSGDGRQLYDAGADPMFVFFTRSESGWRHVSQHRVHTHDVQAAVCILAPLQPDSGVKGDHRITREDRLRGLQMGQAPQNNGIASFVPLVITGGMDGNIVAWAVSKLQTRKPSSRISQLPPLASSAFAVAPRASVIATSLPGSVELWTLPSPESEAIPECAIRIKASFFDHITSLALLPDASALFVGTSTSARIYSVNIAESTARSEFGLQVQASTAKFVELPSGRRILAVGSLNGAVNVYFADFDSQKMQQLAEFSAPPGSGFVRTVDISDDATRLLAIYSRGVARIFNLVATAPLPSTQQPPDYAPRAITTGAFLPQSACKQLNAQGGVLLVLSNNTIRVWDSSIGEPAAWDKQVTAFPAWLSHRTPDHVRSLSFAQDDSTMAFMAGTTFLCGVSLTRPPLAPAESLFADAAEATNFRRIKADRILGTAALDDGSMVMGEVTLPELMKQLPPSVYRKQFGMGQSLVSRTEDVPVLGPL